MKQRPHIVDLARKAREAEPPEPKPISYPNKPTPFSKNPNVMKLHEERLERMQALQYQVEARVAPLGQLTVLPQGSLLRHGDCWDLQDRYFFLIDGDHDGGMAVEATFYNSYGERESRIQVMTAKKTGWIWREIQESRHDFVKPGDIEWAFKERVRRPLTGVEIIQYLSSLPNWIPLGDAPLFATPDSVLERSFKHRICDNDKISSGSWNGISAT